MATCIHCNGHARVGSSQSKPNQLGYGVQYVHTEEPACKDHNCVQQSRCRTARNALKSMRARDDMVVPQGNLRTSSAQYYFEILGFIPHKISHHCSLRKLNGRFIETVVASVTATYSLSCSRIPDARTVFAVLTPSPHLHPAAQYSTSRVPKTYYSARLKLDIIPLNSPIWINSSIGNNTYT